MTPTNDDTEFVDIGTLRRLNLPTLPVLKKEDWKQWWNNVIACFEVLELEKFLIEDIPEPIGSEKKRKWLKCSRFVIVHLLKAISTNVQKDMEVWG